MISQCDLSICWIAVHFPAGVVYVLLCINRFTLPMFFVLLPAIYWLELSLRSTYGFRSGQVGWWIWIGYGYGFNTLIVKLLACHASIDSSIHTIGKSIVIKL